MENNSQFIGTELKMSVAWKGEKPTTVTYRSEYPDETLESIIHGFYTCLIGHTWAPETVIQGMKDFVEARLEESGINDDEKY